MSRSALWRQEGAKKEREKQAEELFELAVEEGRVRHFGCVVMSCFMWSDHLILTRFSFP
jgi:hypothetical protein